MPEPEEYNAELEADALIDPEQLDVELLKQTGPAFSKWARRLVDAKFALAKAEILVVATDAKLDLVIRADPEAFGLTSVTERSIKNAVILHPEYREAQAIELEARKQVMLLEQAVKRMDRRQRALDALVDLYKGEYFAGPSVPRDLVDQWRQIYSGVAAPERGRARRRGEKPQPEQPERRVRRAV